MQGQILKLIGKVVKRALSAADDRPYQSFLYNGRYIEGKIDTVRMYYSFALGDEVKGCSWLDLGCNEGSIPILASADGASRVVGVESNREVVAKAKSRVRESGQRGIDIIQGDVIEYLKSADQFDVISLLAMYRHIHRAFMISGQHDMPKTGRAHLVYDSFQKIIQGKDNPVKEEVDKFVAACLEKCNKYFISSVHDQSGLFLRRKGEVEAYFQSLSGHIDRVEVFPFAAQNSEYIIIKADLKK